MPTRSASRIHPSSNPVRWFPRSRIPAVLIAGFHSTCPLALADETKSEHDDGALLTLPVRFHITHGATITVKGQKMEMWVQPSDLTCPVLDEINRIWKPANIRFTVERAQVEPLLHPDKSIVSKIGRLMGGRKQGYALTPEEIAKARKSARRHLVK